MGDGKRATGAYADRSPRFCPLGEVSPGRRPACLSRERRHDPPMAVGGKSAPWTTQHRRLVGHQADITTVVFSSDGRLLGSSSLDGTARIGDVTSGAPVQVLGQAIRTHSPRLPSTPITAPLPQAALIIPCGCGMRPAASACGCGARGIFGERTVAFSPDGKWLAYSGSDLAIYLRIGAPGCW